MFREAFFFLFILSQSSYAQMPYLFKIKEKQLNSLCFHVTVLLCNDNDSTYLKPFVDPNCEAIIIMTNLKRYFPPPPL